MQKDEKIYVKSFARKKGKYINALLKKEDLINLQTNEHGYIPITLMEIDQDEHGNDYILYLNNFLL